MLNICFICGKLPKWFVVVTIKLIKNRLFTCVLEFKYASTTVLVCNLFVDSIIHRGFIMGIHRYCLRLYVPTGFFYGMTHSNSIFTNYRTWVISMYNF